MSELAKPSATVAASAARPLLLAAGLSAALSAQAQAQPGKTRGTIQDAEIEIVKDRVNTLPEATRNFDKIKLAPPPKPDRKVTYTYPDFRLPATRLNPQVQVLTIAAEDLLPLTGNYLKLGAGNYGTFYGRAHLHSVRNEVYSYGLDIRHQSSASGPVDGKNSGVSQTSVAATGEYYQGSTALGAALDYARERYNFYGYPGTATPPDADNIKQVFNRFGLRAYARNRAPDAQLQYDAGIGYRRWQDYFDNSESNFLLDGKAGYALTETSRLTLQADASFITEKENLNLTQPGGNDGSRSRNFVQVTPAYELTGKTGLSLTLGATLGYSSEPAVLLNSNLNNDAQPNGVSKTAINPAVRVGYAVVPEKFQLYAGLGGAIQRVTRYDLTQENPWLGAGSSQTVADTHAGPNGYVGFTAAPVSGLALALRATYGRARNLYFYRNSLLTPSRFDLVYDSAAINVLTIHAEALYSASEKVRVGFKADYNHYGVNTLAHPYGRPAFLGSLYGTYQASDKLALGATFYYYSPNYGTSSQLGYNPSPFTRSVDVQTDAVIDLNLRADYRITPKFSIFVLANNLANRQYQLYLNYPVKGINAIGGLTYSF